jgi:UDP-N-acetylmuramate: L-alanyl-gamma-D-glutamyl-meso-diaminopimelate ligase
MQDFIDEERVAAAVKGRGHDLTKAFYFPNADSLLEAALPHLVEGDVVLIMSNGSFDGIHQKLLSKIRKLE